MLMMPRYLLSNARCNKIMFSIQTNNYPNYNHIFPLQYYFDDEEDEENKCTEKKVFGFLRA